MMNQDEIVRTLYELNYNVDIWLEHIITPNAQVNFDWSVINVMEQLWKLYKVQNHPDAGLPPHIHQ